MNSQNIIRYKEDIFSNFSGTIVDIETIGDFDQKFKNTDDSRFFASLQQTILGIFGRKGIRIFCANGNNNIGILGSLTLQILDKLEHPLFAFNSNFESCVWYHQLDKRIDFDGELQGKYKEFKSNARKSLGIPNYDDPFDDDGKACMLAWENGKYEKAIAHNRACLLKERDIFLLRGSIKPFPCEYNK
jgi:hypothetical protein